MAPNTVDETQETYAGPGLTSGPSPPPESPGAGVPSESLIGYDPTKPVMSGPLQTEDITGTSFEDEARRAYKENTMPVQIGKSQAKEQFGGSGLIHSDIAKRGEVAGGYDAAMKMIAPDVAFKQDMAKGAEGYKQNIGLGEQRGEQQFALGEQRGEQGLALGEQRGEQQTLRDEQLNQYDVATRERMQEFNVQNEQMRNDFTKEISEMNFGQDMEKSLLSTMQGMITSGNTMLTQLAMSGEATPAEVDKIQESIRNSLTTFSNIWKGSAGSGDVFDFSSIA